MKNIFFVMLMLCCGSVAVAQQIGFTYQATAINASQTQIFGRDSKGQILLNQALKVRFSIHEQSADGTVQYQEVHETSTDIFGIFRVMIGSGEKLLGTSLETLQWSDQAYFMQVEIDLGNGFINMGEEVIVVPPFGLNNSVQLLNLSGTQLAISEGNSVDLGNLLSATRLSEAEVDAFVNNNGYLLLEVDGSVTNELQTLSSNGAAGHVAISDGNQITINVNDADADPLNEIQDLQLSSNQLTITNNPAATIINLSPYLGNNLTEEDVDNMVANNGYLTTELDGSITNEIQDLNLTGNTLSITNNPASTNIDLSPYRNVFETTSGITSNENGIYATDDFVYGSSTLDHPATEGQRNRLFFDKSKGALRAGSTNDASWNDTNRGFYSTAFGFNNIATGVSSFSVGEGNTSSGGSAISLGAGNTSSGSFSLTGGTSNNSIGHASISLGSANNSYGQNSIAIGDNSNANGDYSKVFAHNSTAYSYGETVLGILATAYTPVGDVTPTDRLLTIGNGTYDFNSTPPYSFTRSDALVMLKSGAVTFYGPLSVDADNVTGAGEPYTLPGQDGAANQVMTTDGNGNVSWNTPTTLTETDVDNFVSNNGYLTTEVDGSITNEIQDLNLTGNLLSITNNAAPTNIDLTPYQNVFETTNSVTSNENGNYATDDFVFGSPQLADDGNQAHRNRMFFDKSKAAFRAGRSLNNNWDDLNIGIGSVSLGINTIASGDLSTALGGYSNASGYGSVALAAGTSVGSYSFAANGTASGDYSAALVHGVAQGSSSFAVGLNASATGSSSQALGYHATATNSQSMSFGRDATASGSSATAVGAFSTASGLQSIAMGGQASNSFSTSVGIASNAAGERSTAIGGGLTNSDYGVAIGASAATGRSSVSIGYEAIAQGLQSQAIGAGRATADYSLALFGTATGFSSTTIRGTASASNAISIGGSASGQSSIAIRGIASGISAISIGGTAVGSGSYAIGGTTSVYGTFGIGLGNNVISRDDSETVFGMFNVDDLTNDSGATSKLITIGNGIATNNRSDAFVMLKSGAVTFYGPLTVDADNVTGVGEPYTLPGQDGAANQVMTTDGNGNVSWNTPTTLTETDVDNFVSNNGYLTTEVDGSITNEIQDLNLTGNTLSITNNAAPTNIDLTPYQNVFETTNNVTSNENGNYATDDFVFGSPQLADDGNPNHDARIFFDKSKGAFRAGIVNGNQWNDANIGESSLAVGEGIASGLFSVAFGRGIASGANSFAMISGNASGISSVAIGAGTQAVGGRSMAFGSQTAATGTNAIAFGELTRAEGMYSVAFGWNSAAFGRHSFVNGYDCIAEGQASFAHGWNVHALGHSSLAIGSSADAIGDQSVALGVGTRAYSINEFSLGSYNTEYTPTNSITDRLFVIGNGLGNGTRSDAFIMLKNGNTTLHGELTFDADNVTGAGEPYTLPGQDGVANQVMTTDGNGNVSWNTPTTLTETDVDNFVSNNGYLTTEVDGSITNEIQDLNLTGNLLSITNNAAPTNIDLTPYQNVFETTNGVTSNENGSYTTDSFVIGSPSLDDDGDGNHDTRLLFEKSTGAFRVGTVTDTRWDAAERGTNSVAMGLGNIARGGSSLSLGQNNLAHSASSVAIGTNNVAEGYNSVALGRNVATTGVHSMALSLYSASRSYGETTMGVYAADYVPNSTTNFDGNDRLFTIGNGLDDANRSNAFVILKNGDATLLGTLTDASDMRLKRNIKPLQNSLFSLNNLQGVHYQWNGRKPQDTLALQTGLIAQEVEKIFPELVKTDEEGFKSVNYIGVIPHLIEAIKELKKENDELKSETIKTKTSTEQRIAAMEAKLMRIEALVENVKH